MNNYYTAQICKNGHVISACGEGNEKYCSLCGSETITRCLNCNSNIRGDLIDPGFINTFPYEVPKYCYNCGKPYPWTQSQLEEISKLFNSDDKLLEEDKDYINKNISSIISNNPNTKVVATKFKTFLQKAREGTASAIRDILVDVASETAKKIIFK